MVKAQIKLYATGATTADNVASAIIPVQCALVLLSWAIVGTTTGTVGGSLLYQVGYQSTGQFNTNDMRNVIDECLIFEDAVATGVMAGVNKITIGSGWKFNAGDRVYLHRNVANTALATSLCNLCLTFA